MRLAFKRPGFLFFRRMFFVKSVEKRMHEGEPSYLVKAVFGQMLIPAKDTVLKVMGRGHKNVVL